MEEQIFITIPAIPDDGKSTRRKRLYGLLKDANAKVKAKNSKILLQEPHLLVVPQLLCVHLRDLMLTD